MAAALAGSIAAEARSDAAVLQAISNVALMSDLDQRLDELGRQFDGDIGIAVRCGSACKRDPVMGVIGV